MWREEEHALMRRKERGGGSVTQGGREGRVSVKRARQPGDEEHQTTAMRT